MRNMKSGIKRSGNIYTVLLQYLYSMDRAPRVSTYYKQYVPKKLIKVTTVTFLGTFCILMVKFTLIIITSTIIPCLKSDISVVSLCV